MLVALDGKSSQCTENSRMNSGARMNDGIDRIANDVVVAVRSKDPPALYADQMASILKQLQNVYGTPGNSGTLETALNKFTTALQALSTSAGSSSAQTVAVGAAQALAKQLNVTTNGIQSLRSNVEQDLGTSAQQANAAMQQVATSTPSFRACRQTTRPPRR